MDSYSELANCYDIFMDNIPYDEWLTYILEKFEKYNVPKELVLDLGCGTGTLTEMLADCGYDMIGVDSSEEMLQQAIEKRDESGHEILYLLQDMREFELYGTVRAIVSICDSINYLLEDEDVLETFKLVNNYLDPDGIFIFDFNTVYKYKEIIGDTTIAENRENYSFIWDNYFHEDEHINEYELTIFSKEGELYKKTNETHYQRGYTVDEMVEFIKAAGMEVLEVTDAETNETVTETSERVHIIAKEKGKVWTK